MFRALALAALLCAACRLNADYGGTEFRCSDGVCPAGYTCVAEVCRLGAPDAGLPDAPEPPDGSPPPPDATIQQPDAAPPPLCGRPDVFTDDFEDGVTGTMWGWGWQDTGTPVTESGGHAIFTLNTPDYSGYSTSRWFNLHDGRFFIEIPVMVNVLTDAEVIFHALGADDPGERLTFVQHNGALELSTRGGGTTTVVDSVSYDATGHRWWQLRSTGGTTYWETSPNGIDWTVQAMVPDPAFIGHARIELEVGTYQPETSPGQAHIDNMNGGAPPTGRWCPTASASDDFDDGVESVLWTRSYGGACVKDENGGQATFTPSGASSNYCGYVSGTSYDLTASSATIELVQAPAAGSTGSLAFFKAERDNDNAVELVATGSGNLQARTWIDGSIASIESMPYDPVAHRWLRLLEQSGQVVWQTSPNGIDWTTMTTATVPFPLTRVDAVFGAGTNAATAIAPGTIRFDNYNLAP